MWHLSNSLAENHCNIPPRLVDKSNTAIICGRYSGEVEASQRSAQTILKQVDQSLFTPYLAAITADTWSVTDVTGREGMVDRVLTTCSGVEEATFTAAYITIHGTPGENGLLQGYLNILGISYTTGGMLYKVLTFNKEAYNAYLTHHDLHTARSQRLRNQTREFSPEEQQQTESTLRLPLSVKPNTGGPSIATVCIERQDQFAAAVVDAHTTAPDMLVKECIVGAEVTCSCMILPDEALALPATGVVTHDTFFDCGTKYYGKNDEITSACISPELTQRVQETSLTIAHLLSCYGSVCIDFTIETDGIPTSLEADMASGMTEASFIPQQVRVAGLQLNDLITRIIKSKLL